MDQITPYSSRLRFLDADDLDDSTVHFGDLRVIGTDGHKLGDLDGFIVDSVAARVQFAVVDAGGWFRSRQLLLPIGHARLDREGRAIRVDVARDALENYPEYDSDRFREFSDDEMKAFAQRISVVCCPDETKNVTGAIQYDTLRHYAQPDWWRSDYNRPERYRELGTGQWTNRPVTSPATPALAVSHQTRDTVDRELVTGFDRDHASTRDRGRTAPSVEEVERAGGEVSPHPGRRAQPGDVLGIETGGERSRE
jgi:PRC-barrel domain protein